MESDEREQKNQSLKTNVKRLSLLKSQNKEYFILESGD